MTARRHESQTRPLRIVITVALIAAVIAAGWQARWLLVPEPSGEQMVTIDDLNLRSGPGLDYGVLDVLPAGTEVVQRGVAENGFVRISSDGVSGWVASEYLSSPGAAPQTSALSTHEQLSTQPLAGASEPADLDIPVEADIVPDQPVSLEVVAPTMVPQAAPISVPTAVPASPGEKWIEVDRTNRTVTLHNGDLIVGRFDALIGKDLSADGYYSTAVGTYEVWIMEEQLAETPFADGVYLTHFVGFDPARSNGFHSPTRDSAGNIVITGGTQTLGCVRLSEADAIQLFTFAHIGMRVEVHD